MVVVGASQVQSIDLCCSVAQSCPSLCDATDRTKAGFPVLGNTDKEGRFHPKAVQR